MLTSCFTTPIVVRTSCDTRELEAEAVAFVVEEAIGLEVTDSACDYIHLYRGDVAALA